MRQRVRNVRGNMHHMNEPQGTDKKSVITPMETDADETNASASHDSAYNGYPMNFREAIQERINNCRQTGKTTALIVFSIDNLAMIMQGYGHQTSEQAIQEIMHETAQLIGENDIIARIQKDQFAVLLHESEKETAQNLTENIHRHIKCFGSNSQYGSLHILCSAVCVGLPEMAGDANNALDQAYIHLKSQHDIVFPELEETPHASASCRQEMGLANYLARAIRDNRLRMAYQPVINSQTGEIAHYEALLRNVSDDGTISSAGALIPIAERMGLIHMIDTMVLEKVVRDLEEDSDVCLAFNVSNLTTDDDRWLNTMKRLVEGRPEIAHRMIVEITETAIHRDLAKTAYFVASIQAMGAQVALDDFGSGYTSFRQLKSLSVDMVKIDGAYVRDLVDNPDNRFFVKTLLEFAQGFSLKTVAEFVENGEVAKMLMELGVEYMQGYYFGRPENRRRWISEDQ